MKQANAHRSKDPMTKKKSIFTSAQARAVAMNIKIPAETKKLIDNLKNTLQTLDHTLSFNVSQICGDALLQAIRQGESELVKMRASGTIKAT